MKREKSEQPPRDRFEVQKLAYTPRVGQDETEQREREDDARYAAGGQVSDGA